MAKRLGIDASLAAATHVINERQVDRLISIVAEHTKPGDRVAVLGLSYKPDTDVIERSQGVMLAAALGRIGLGVVAHDPLAMEPARAALAGASFAGSPEEAVTSAAAVVVMVPWPEYKNFFASWPGGERTNLVVDCWRLLTGAPCGARIRVVQLGNNESLTAAGIAAAVDAAE